MNWVLVGGGPHAVILARALSMRTGIADGEITIVDPNQSLLSDWLRRADACGMRHLRSPGAHGLEPDFGSLRRWASQNEYSWDKHTIAPYSRPGIDMWNSYAREIAAACEPFHIRDRVVELLPDPGPGVAPSDHENSGTVARLEGGRGITAKNIVLAVGGNRLKVPRWAKALSGARHIYSPGFDRRRFALADRPVIIGGGVSALQLAISVARARMASEERGAFPANRPVTILSRHEVKVSQFDSDPCFGGPRCLGDLLRIENPSERRQAIDAARNPGSVPPDVEQSVASLVASGQIDCLTDEVVSAGSQSGGVSLETAGGLVLRSDSVALATGFEPGVPARDLVGQIRLHCREKTGRDAPVNDDGMPIPDEFLKWGGVYLTGRLAEHELGPGAPNLIGAHNAAKRIISGLDGAPRRVPVAWHRYGNGAG